MGTPLVIMVTVIAGNGYQCCRYEGTGRSLSLKLIDQLRQQSAVGGSSGKLCVTFTLIMAACTRFLAP